MDLLSDGEFDICSSWWALHLWSSSRLCHFLANGTFTALQASEWSFALSSLESLLVTVLASSSTVTLCQPGLIVKNSLESLLVTVLASSSTVTLCQPGLIVKNSLESLLVTVPSSSTVTLCQPGLIVKSPWRLLDSICFCPCQLVHC